MAAPPLETPGQSGVLPCLSVPAKPPLPSDLVRSNSHHLSPSCHSSWSPQPQLIPAAEWQISALINDNALIKQPVIPRGHCRWQSLGSRSWLCPAPHRCLTTDTPAQGSISLSEFQDLGGFVESVLLGKKKKKPKDFNTGCGRTVAIFSLEGTLKL